MLYVLSLALWMKRRDAGARLAWTAGCALYLAHVAAAFALRHHWSHAAAYQETARQTREVFGIDSGAGIYFNYAFTILWIADALWWWLAGLDRYRTRPRRVTVAVHLFFAFMFFNGAIVFGSPFMRWLGTAAILILLVVAASRLPPK
ncbi:MAG: hypothetical protein LAO79_13635 [Acidobacteriia bacterium]|nr:hypothetical protein [Terriglobia bacterium]